MQKLLSYVRRAVDHYHMIEEGDRIAVGVSGGKDSLALLVALAGLRAFYPKKFEVVAITLEMGYAEMDFSPVGALCDTLGVEYIRIPTQIGPIIFDIRKEENPCALCAKMRRGALHEAAKAAGCKKVALGHHFDDVVETFVMNLFNEGRVGCFAPKTWLSRKELWMIRPMVFAPEADVRRAASQRGLPVVKSKCPADGHTSREDTKAFLAEKERESPGFKLRLFGALRRSGLDGWGYPDENGKAGMKGETLNEETI